MEASTWLLSVFLVSLILTSFVACNNGKGLDKDTCIFVDHVEREVDYDHIACTNNTICNKHFNITYIKVPPYVYTMNGTYWGIDEILLKCCGPCVRYHNKVLNNITELTSEVLQQSDMVFPIFSRSSTTKLYGSYYLPYITAPPTIYVTKNRDGLLRSLFNCYPIVVLCVLLSVVAGFVAWLLETWGNEEEFPRPFLIGCFEGFWWAFVSMTTVGYGDKTPKSVAARLYSVIWIMIGIIGFGVLTGQLTGEIVKASSPPNPSMKGKDVGVLRFRDHDSLAVVFKGGKAVRNAEAYDFRSDITQLISKLQRNEIDGLVLDKWALAYIMLWGEEIVPAEQLKFFISETTHTEKVKGGESHSYGILMREKETFHYFEDFVKDSQDRWAVISEEWWMKEQRNKFGKLHFKANDVLLSPSQPLFKKLLVIVVVLIALTMFFGLLCELKRRRCGNGRREYKNGISLNCSGRCKESKTCVALSN